MISLFKHIEQSESLLARFQALRKAYLDLVTDLPKAALPANPELSALCKEEVDRVASQLKDTEDTGVIDEGGKAAISQLEAIYHSNRAALEERDAALKDVVSSVAEVISGFKGHGERQEGHLSQLADEFDSLARVDDVSEIRRRLRGQVHKLREAAQEIRIENTRTVQQFASQISAYQKRLEDARKESGIDRLTGLGSRREAERHLRSLPKNQGAVSILLFDVEGFKAINDKFGTLFGDKLLRALTHVLKSRFPEEARLFRWGADEFLVVADGSLRARTEQCRDLCRAFATGGKYSTTLDDGSKLQLAATTAFGAVEYTNGESAEEVYRRARAALDENRKSLRR